MKKASKILLIIAGVFNLLVCIGLFITGLVYAILAFVTGTLVFEGWAVDIQEMLEAMGVPEDAMRWVLATVFALICLLVFGALAIIWLVGTIIAFKGSKPKKRSILIANIVFGIICENILGLVGGILGVIGFSKEPKPEEEPLPEPEPAPVEEEPKQLEEPKVEEAPVVEEKKEEPKPEAPKKAAREDWFCPNCGAHNTSKFCASCGTKRPE